MKKHSILDKNELNSFLLFNFSLEPVEIYSTLTKVKVKMFYAGKNRNRTVIDQDTGVAEKLARTALGQPIVASYYDDINEIGGHTQKQYVENGDVKVKFLNTPFGFIPTNSEIWTEEEEINNEIKTYYCTYGFLWTKRYPQINELIKKPINHSMELDGDTIKCEYFEDEEKNIWCNIQKAQILGLSMLADWIEPCFENSTIEEFSTEDEEVNSLIRDIEDLQLSQEIETKELHQVFSKNNFIGRSAKRMKFNVEIPVSSFAEIFKAINPYNAESDIFQLKYSILEVGTDSVVAVNIEDGTTQRFSYKNNNGEIMTESKEIVVNKIYSSEEFDSISEKITKFEEYNSTVADLEGKTVVETEAYEALEATVADLEGKTVVETEAYEAMVAANESIEGLNEEIANLSETVAAYQKAEKEALIAEFSVLGEEVLAPFKESIDVYSIEDLKKELCVLGYQNKINFSAIDDSRIVIDPEVPEVSYADEPEWVKAAKKFVKEKSKGDNK